MVVSLPTHICVTRLQCLNYKSCDKNIVLSCLSNAPLSPLCIDPYILDRLGTIVCKSFNELAGNLGSSTLYWRHTADFDAERDFRLITTMKMAHAFSRIHSIGAFIVAPFICHIFIISIIIHCNICIYL